MLYLLLRCTSSRPQVLTFSLPFTKHSLFFSNPLNRPNRNATFKVKNFTTVDYFGVFTPHSREVNIGVVN